MPHLEGVITLVTGSGPWWRVQGRHVRGESPSVRVDVDPHSGVTVDVHFGAALWLRLGWVPTHAMCRAAAKDYPVGATIHRCWGRLLRPGVYDLRPDMLGRRWV